MAMRQELSDPRDRISPYREEVFSQLESLLNDSDPRVRSAAAQALAVLGPETRDSVPRLEQLAIQDQDPRIMLALCRIARTPKRVERVKKWIHDRQSQWEVLANSLSQAMPREEAIAFLREEYFRTGDYQLRQPLVGAINQLEIEGLEEQHEGTRDE